MSTLLACALRHATTLIAAGLIVATPASSFAALALGTPICTTARECEVMWLEAQEVVQQLTGMRIRLLTDQRIETFDPVGSRSVGAAVTKYPVSEGAYEIRLQLECRYGDCGEIRKLGAQVFNGRLINSLTAMKP